MRSSPEGWLRLLRSLPALLALGAASGCQPHEPVLPSVVVVSLDTLRPDRLSGYGSPRGTSPVLDALARAGITFLEARSQSSGTLNSHLSLLTSLYPGQVGITRADGRNVDMFTTRLRLPAGVTTLAEVLRGAGYETAAFTGGGFVGARWGLSQGFSVYEENRTRFDGLRTTLARLRKYLAARDPEDAPLFLFLHTYDIHEPYSVDGPLGRRYSPETYHEMAERLGYPPVPSLLNQRLGPGAPPAADVLDLYDNGIRDTDLVLGDLFRILREHGLWDDAIVVILSDHGEEFLEHGRFNHGPTVYEELVRVPLVVKLPRGARAGTVVRAPVALLDVAPTVMDLAGLPPSADFQGWSLVPLMEGEGGERFRTRPLPLDVPDKREGLGGLWHDDWVLFDRGARNELYDLRSDPDQSTDRGAFEVSRAESLATWLAALEAEHAGTGRARGWEAEPIPGDETLPEDLRRQLDALGYAD